MSEAKEAEGLTAQILEAQRNFPVTREEIVRIRNTTVGKEHVQIWSRMLHHLCDAAEALRSLDARRSAIGAQITVPREPTGPMIDAFLKRHHLTSLDAIGTYKAMLAAAPAASPQQEPVGWMDHKGGIITAGMKAQVDPPGDSIPSAYNIPLVPQRNTVRTEPHAGAWRWIDDAVKVLRKAASPVGAEGALDAEIANLLMGTPCPQEDLGFDSPADREARRTEERLIEELPELGGTYATQGGRNVTMVAINNPGTHIETLVDNAGVNRYSRRLHDMGRVTGSAHDYSDPNNLVRPIRCLNLKQMPSPMNNGEPK